MKIQCFFSKIGRYLQFFKIRVRTISFTRKTNETKIKISLNLDGTGNSSIDTGIKFFDHMLDQLCKYS